MNLFCANFSELLWIWLIPVYNKMSFLTSKTVPWFKKKQKTIKMTKASCISKVSISFTRHKEDSKWSKLRKRHLKSVVQDIRLIQKQLTIRGHKAICILWTKPYRWEGKLMTSCPEIPLPISKSAKRMSVDNIFMSTFLLLSSPPLVAEY